MLLSTMSTYGLHHLEYNALFKMNIRTHHIDYVGSFPNEEFQRYWLYTSINECNGKLYFTPGSAYEIGVYDVKSQRFEKINIGITKQDNDLSKIKYARKFMSCFVYDNNLILIPWCYDKTIYYDTVAGTLSVSNELFDYFYTKYKNFTTFPGYLCCLAGNINESEIVFNLFCSKNIVFFYNLQTKEYREKPVGNEQRTFKFIEYDDKQVYLYDDKANILIKWGIEDCKYSECHIADNVPEFKPGVWLVPNIVVMGKRKKI
ncbi:MAG: hypothetical protein J1F64_08695 [Oscillospiraceae bacterium]|nr:hypothetical protein [Oscillospiraceae bacterium]